MEEQIISRPKAGRSAKSVIDIAKSSIKEHCMVDISSIVRKSIDIDFVNNSRFIKSRTENL